MDALVLAAGLGTRLRPLTDTTPKVLIELGGMTLLERIIRQLVAAGADRVIVNAHHHAGQIERFLASRDDLGAELLVSLEAEAPLETGGGLLHAAPLLRRDAPFWVVNGDIVTDADLGAQWAAHAAGGALATLAVNERPTSRYLLFDAIGLCGREDARESHLETVRPTVGSVRRIAFAGIHVVSPAIFALLTERGAFSIRDAYLRLAAAGHVIRPHDVTGARWLEIGTPERLARARAELEKREG